MTEHANGDGVATKRKPKATAMAPAVDVKACQRAAILLKQASDATRLRILLMLAGGEMHVGAMCDELNQTQPAVSHHLALLRHGSLIVPKRRGKQNFYELTDSGRRLAAVAGQMTG